MSVGSISADPAAGKAGETAGTRRLRFGLGAGALLLVAGLSALVHPQVAAPAATLAAALALEVAGRLAMAAATRRVGLRVALRGLPSLVLAAGRLPGVCALALLVCVAAWPERLALLLGLAAGLLAMSAFAQLSLARIVLSLREQAADP
ncbi:hypothetical protein MMB17_23730 [Methylobacterium organophilum]|uniref:hypothetical protein n=1 Tax=Methylobacterium organophilum TaxID=410 RepID=UPI001F12A31B|nr:hypothetical protein [Methylobacterium organophilum]UMY17582.1 hypothetical protein MMB17_23730 [Methylobacterium organophilum]